LTIRNALQKRGEDLSEDLSVGNKPFFENEQVCIFNENILTTRSIDASTIDLIVTSPPYNVDIQYNSHNDKVTYEEYLAFSEAWMTRCYGWLKNDGRFCLNIPLDKNKGGQQSVGADLTTIAKKAGFPITPPLSGMRAISPAGPRGGRGQAPRRRMLSRRWN
jgi:hypothetical protein